MNAIQEYGERKEQKGHEEGIKQGRNNIIQKLYQSGMNPEEIADRTQMNLKTVNKIINTE